MRTRSMLIAFVLFLTILLSACNFPKTGNESLDTVGSQVAATLTALGAPAILSSSTPNPAENVSPTPVQPTETPQPTATPQNPLVLETILCWQGPGTQYEVVSALKKGERVELIGQGSIAGWWIVNNPIYHDPCWAQAEYLQLEPGYNPYILPIYTPPPTPTPTPTNTPTPTPTNTP